MRKAVAVIVVRSPKVFDWLGHMPIMNWSVNQLKEVRGVHRTVCCATRELAERAAKLLAREEIETVTIPAVVINASNSDQVFDRWLCAADGPAAEAEVVVVIKPTSPFLPAAKIEACTDLVLRKFADTCCTVQQVQAWTSSGRTQAYVEVPGCRAFAPARVTERLVVDRFRPVPVSLIESLDVCDPDNHRLAKALVADGSV